MVLAADYPLLEVFWTIALIALWILWISLVVYMLADNFTRDDHGGWAKAGWTVLIIFVPLLGIIIYTIARPSDLGGPGRRSEPRYYGDPNEELLRMTDLRNRGALTDAELEREKQRLLR